MFSTTTYRGYEIVKDDNAWMVINEYGSGHVCESLEDCRETIDGWNK